MADRLNIAREVAAFKRMTVKELRGRYVEVFGEATRSGNKDWLWKRIAWRIQANAEGGLTERGRQAPGPDPSQLPPHVQPAAAGVTPPRPLSHSSPGPPQDEAIAPEESLDRCFRYAEPAVPRRDRLGWRGGLQAEAGRQPRPGHRQVRPSREPLRNDCRAAASFNAHRAVYRLGGYPALHV